MLASPSPATTSPGYAAPSTVSPASDDEDDDGSPDTTGMAATLAATSSASQASPEVGDFDQNVTQENSGSDNAGTELWRNPKAGRWNRYLNEIWDEVLDVDYVSPSPSVQYMFQPPPMRREDNNPRFNNQPWTYNTSFQATDPTQYFETDPSNSAIPSTDEDTGDDE